MFEVFFLPTLSVHWLFLYKGCHSLPLFIYRFSACIQAIPLQFCYVRGAYTTEVVVKSEGVLKKSVLSKWVPGSNSRSRGLAASALARGAMSSALNSTKLSQRHAPSRSSIGHILHLSRVRFSRMRRGLTPLTSWDKCPHDQINYQPGGWRHARKSSRVASRKPEVSCLLGGVASRRARRSSWLQCARVVSALYSGTWRRVRCGRCSGCSASWPRGLCLRAGERGRRRRERGDGQPWEGRRGLAGRRQGPAPVP